MSSFYNFCQGFGARLTDNGDFPLEGFGHGTLYGEDKEERERYPTERGEEVKWAILA